GGCLLFIEQLIEKHYLSCNLLPPRRCELIEVIDNNHLCRDPIRRGGISAEMVVIDNNHLCRDPIRRGGRGTAECGQHNLLASAGSLRGIINEFGSFYSPHPVRNSDFFQANFEANFS